MPKTKTVKRFYKIHSTSHEYEVIDLDSITYLKISVEKNVVGKPRFPTVKVSWKITANGQTLTGNEYRKPEGGRPVWAERLARAWEKYRKQVGDL